MAEQLPQGVLRDQMSDVDRHGAPKDRAAAMVDCYKPPMTLADQAEMDRAAGRPTVGTRGEGG